MILRFISWYLLSCEVWKKIHQLKKYGKCGIFLKVKKVKQKQIVTLDIIEVNELNRITWVESWT